MVNKIMRRETGIHTLFNRVMAFLDSAVCYETADFWNRKRPICSWSSSEEEYYTFVLCSHSRHPNKVGSVTPVHSF